ncbi:MAG: hypothetical protein V3U39_07740 [Acidimicrobiia bacterium]|jgi:hypothetical protein
MIRAALVAATLLVVAACNGGSGGTTADPALTTRAPTTTSRPQATTVPADTATTSTTTTTTTTVPGFDLIEVDLTAPGDDPGRVPVELGHTVRLVITADTTDEVHLHGYDIKASVAPGSPAVLDFVADIPGIFDVELEGTGQEIMQLQVAP